MSTVGCTLGFIVTSGSHLYATTAGHCAQGFGGIGRRAVTDAPVGEFSTVAYVRCAPECDWGRDFALIRIARDKAHLVDPAVDGWSRPEAIWTGTDFGTAREVWHSGWGIGLGSDLVRVDGDGVPLYPERPPTRHRRGVVTRATSSPTTPLAAPRGACSAASPTGAAP